MTTQKLIKFCLTFPFSYEDYPFGPDFAVMRHKSNKKSFAIIRFQKDKELIVNLKCDPMEADFFRNIYKSVTPGWHMTNKAGWNTIALKGDVPDNVLRDMVGKSYDLIKPKSKKK